MWDAKRCVLRIKSLKHGIIQDKRDNVMRAVFGIDVSKTSSEVAILVNGEKVHGYTILNDAIEAIGVYSQRLQAFLEEYGYAYTRLNLSLCTIVNQLTCRKKFINTYMI